MKQPVVIIFAKNPVYGTVKTRLAATLGNDEALRIYHILCEHTKSVTSKLPMDKTIFYSDYVEEQDIWECKLFSKHVQVGEDLGERMKNAFTFVFSKGYAKAVIIGTDCPTLDDQIIQDAFDKLDAVDVVVGPAYDGGYYLLGLKRMHSFLFENMHWSTEAVLQETIKRCEAHQLSILRLQQMHDLDDEKDLKHFRMLKL